MNFKKTTILITIISVIISAACLIALIRFEKDGIDKIYLNLANALFGVFLSVIFVNVLVEKALDREKKWLENLEKEREERQRKIEIEKEKKGWDFIHLYLFEKILMTAIEAAEIIAPIYSFFSKNGIRTPIGEMERFLILRCFDRFQEERQTYSLYLSRFIHKMEKDHIKKYRSFEKLYSSIRKPDDLFWGNLIRHHDELTDISKRSQIHFFVNDVGSILSLTEDYIIQVLDNKLIQEIESEVNNLALNNFLLESGTHVGMIHLIKPDKYFEEYNKYDFDFSNTLSHFFLCKRCYTEYEKFFNKDWK